MAGLAWQTGVILLPVVVQREMLRESLEAVKRANHWHAVHRS
jgi:hypothetical protein